MDSLGLFIVSLVKLNAVQMARERALGPFMEPRASCENAFLPGARFFLTMREGVGTFPKLVHATLDPPRRYIPRSAHTVNNEKISGRSLARPQWDMCYNGFWSEVHPHCLRAELRQCRSARETFVNLIVELLHFHFSTDRANLLSSAKIFNTINSN